MCVLSGSYYSCFSIGECPSNPPFLKNNGAEAQKGRGPLFLRNGEIRGHSPT